MKNKIKITRDWIIPFICVFIVTLGVVGFIQGRICWNKVCADSMKIYLLTQQACQHEWTYERGSVHTYYHFNPEWGEKGMTEGVFHCLKCGKIEQRKITESEIEAMRTLGLWKEIDK